MLDKIYRDNSATISRDDFIVGVADEGEGFLTELAEGFSFFGNDEVMPVKYDLSEEKLGAAWVFSPKSIRQILDRENQATNAFKKVAEFTKE